MFVAYVTKPCLLQLCPCPSRCAGGERRDEKGECWSERPEDLGAGTFLPVIAAAGGCHGDPPLSLDTEGAREMHRPAVLPGARLVAGA